MDQREPRGAVRTGLLVAVIVPLAILSVPFIVLAGLTVRGALLLAIPVVLLGLALSPRLRRLAREELGTARTNPYFQLPHRVRLHERHAWARRAMGDVTVGADDLVQRLLGPVEAVELPNPGDRVAPGTPLFYLRRGDRKVAVETPLSGWVAATNGELARYPRLVNADPYGLGWAVRLEPTDRHDLAQLRGGLDARRWLDTEADRLLGMLAADGLQPVTLQDGGVLADDLYLRITDPEWARVNAAFFGGGPR